MRDLIARAERFWAHPFVRISASAIFVLSLLPSWTALSEQLARAWPGLYAFTGPLNPLKLALPFLLPLAAWELTTWNTRQRKLLAGVATIGALFTGLAWLNCRPNHAVLREGFVMGAGVIAAIAFQRFNSAEKLRIGLVWSGLLLLTCLFDFFRTGVNPWLLQNLFDPMTIHEGTEELRSDNILRGVFGRQSLAKLLAWLPFITLALAWSDRAPNARQFSLGFCSLLAFGAFILPTSQRGPFLGFAAGVILLAVLGARSFSKKRIAAMTALVLIGSFSVAWLRTDSGIWESRVAPYLPKSDGKIDLKVLKHSQGTVYFRRDMTLFSLEQIAQNPLGNACIAEEKFRERGLIATHSHNLFLQQFIARGWIWGLIHLLLWAWAFARTMRSRNIAGAAWAAACASMTMGGLFDHPWFVLNHSILLCVVLLESLKLKASPRAQV
jgi:hypothetical protein